MNLNEVDEIHKNNIKCQFEYCGSIFSDYILRSVRLWWDERGNRHYSAEMVNDNECLHVRIEKVERVTTHE